VQVALDHSRPRVSIGFGLELEPHIEAIAQQVEARGGLSGLQPRWVALKLLESDPQVSELAQESLADSQALMAQVETARRHIQRGRGR